MKKNLGTFILAICGLFAWHANADVIYNFTFDDTTASTPGTDVANGQLTAHDNGDGTFTFVSGYIDVTGGGGNGLNNILLQANANAPGGTSTFISGDFTYTYDDQWAPANGTTPLSGNGLVFSSGGDTIAFGAAGVGTANYFFSVQEAPHAPLQVAFNFDGLSPGATFSLTAVPEPVNYALAAFGMIFVGGSVGRFYLGRRRSATAS